jgi:ABC-2 type transport system ATP-binding protein
MEAAVQLDRVRLRIGKREIIGGLDLEIPRGDSIGIIGPNGAGKTTLYRMLRGLARASSGTVQVLGRRMPDRRVLSQIGYMAQSESLYADLSIEENLRFFGSLYDLGGADADRRIDEVLALVDLADRRGDRVESLSGGMRRRVSLAVAILHSPSLLLLDEPTVGVDPELRVALWDEFMRLNESGVTILVSTHHLDEANRCRRLALLAEGKLLACDTPAELKRSTAQDSIEDAFLELARRRKS